MTKEYQEFVDKFKPKKTTDDCYTPPGIYGVVKDWAVKEYGLEDVEIVRPFYPGGDYENYSYPENSVVIDNPPFSILSKIVKFYLEWDIKFFLFSPGLTIMNYKDPRVCKLCVGATIEYENGAKINTSFLTNLDEYAVRSVPDLYKALEADRDKGKPTLPKYIYPAYVITSARINKFSKYGLSFKVKASQSHHIRRLDHQKKHGKAVFGTGYIVSKGLAEKLREIETEVKNRAGSIEWELSDDEKEIIRGLEDDQ